MGLGGCMQLGRRFQGKKFMWDGRVYPDEKQAQEVARKYRHDSFDAELVKEEDRFYVFTRKEVKEAVVEGKP